MLANDNTDLIASLRAQEPAAQDMPVVVTSAPSDVSAIVNNSDNAAISMAEVAKKKEITMADIVTGTVTGQLDITSILEGQSDIRRENVVESKDIVDAVKTAGWANSDRTGTEADRVVAQDTAYFIAGQSQNFSNATALAALKASTDAQFAQTLAAIQLAASASTAAAALAGEKTAAASALAAANLSKDLVADGASTRALINQLKMDELNRQLSERHASLVESKADARYAHGAFTNGQFAAMQSAVQNLNSQVNETRQGLVNFGSMTGSAGQQTSTANNVR